MKNKLFAPEAAAGLKSAANDEAPFGDKHAVAKLAGGFSKRWVDLQMAAGMPHLRVGQRRVRFDLAEVREWLREKYHVQRRGAGRATAKRARLAAQAAPGRTAGSGEGL